MLLLALTGCELLTPYLEEVREDPVEILYGGSVLQGVPSGENEVLSEGTVRFFSLDGSLLAEAEQPYSSSPGFWRARVPVDYPYGLRIEAEDSYPSLWRATTPSQAGIWFTGALFSWPHSQVDPFFDALADNLGIEIADLKTENVVHLWGQVNNPEFSDLSSWPVRDGDGKRPDLYGYEILEDGSMRQTEQAPMHYVFAFNLTPGDIEVAGVTYTAQAGDLISAWWYEVLE